MWPQPANIPTSWFFDRPQKSDNELWARCEQMSWEEDSRTTEFANGLWPKEAPLDFTLDSIRNWLQQGGRPSGSRKSDNEFLENFEYWQKSYKWQRSTRSSCSRLRHINSYFIKSARTLETRAQKNMTRSQPRADVQPHAPGEGMSCSGFSTPDKQNPFTFTKIKYLSIDASQLKLRITILHEHYVLVPLTFPVKCSGFITGIVTHKGIFIWVCF